MKQVAALPGRLKRRRTRQRGPRDPAVRIVGEIPGTLKEIVYQRPAGSMRGKRIPPATYFHRFESSARMFAMSDGSLLIKPTGRRKLFEEIPD